MKKMLLFATVLIVALPMNSQLLSKLFGGTLVKGKEMTGMKVSPGQTDGRIQPKRSVLVDLRRNPDAGFKVRYDVFGHKTEVVDPAGLSRDIEEYDASGKIMLNKYTQTRAGTNDAWQEPKRYNLRTTVNEAGIRTAIEQEDWDEIRLNESGLVTSYGTGVEDEYIGGTQTWEGNKLTGLTQNLRFGEEFLNLELKEIELAYPLAEFSPYEINCYDYLFEPGEIPAYFGVNASGTMEAAAEGMDISMKLTIDSYVEEIDPSNFAPTHVTRGKVGNGTITLETFKYKFTYTDENGSFLYSFEAGDGENLLTNTYTINYDAQGNLIRQQVKQQENDETTFDYIYRYEWSYDDQNKPLKVETYYSTEPDYSETLILSEEFTEWYDPANIHAIQQPEGTILGAMLYTLSGIPVKKLTADEVNTNFEVPAQGIYLLNVQTDKGGWVKKIVR